MEVRGRAPGKIIIAGEHAVVHGATAIAASIDLYTEVHLALRPSGQEDELLELDLKDTGLNISWPCSRLKEILGESCFSDSLVLRPCTSEKLELLSGLVAEENISEETIQLTSAVYVFLFLYTSILGFKPGKAIVTSRLPMGSGLGSSAAFCVALSGALVALSEGFYSNTKEKKGWFSFEKTDLELINKWAFEGEKIIHGKPSGIDNTVSTFGSMIKFKKETKANIITPLNSSRPLKMLITDTRVGRNTKALVSSVSERASRHPLAMTSIFDAINSISDELALLVESPAVDEVEVSEKEEKLMELMQMNQGLLQCLGVSHESIETIARTTMKEKLISKLTGAGGGGCVLTFLPTLLSATVTEKVISELEECGFRCFMVEVGGKGLEVFSC